MQADAHALIDGVAVTERLFAGGGVALLGSPPAGPFEYEGALRAGLWLPAPPDVLAAGLGASSEWPTAA